MGDALLPTSSKTGTLYFAFGSNLSPTQMKGRLGQWPSSSVPIAVARLDGWEWVICERGYANIIERPGLEIAAVPNGGGPVAVWGVLYNLSPEAEARLDLYEGHDGFRNPHVQANPDVRTRMKRPFLQGDWVELLLPRRTKAQSALLAGLGL